LHRWFAAYGRDLPWRKTQDPYAILVSEFMLQQTTVAAVIPFYERWLRKFPNFGALAAAREQTVLRAWEGLGYYSRARNLHKLAKEIVTKHHGQFPSDPAAASKLPGIGPYTLGAVMSFAFDLPLPAIDVNVERVLARLYDISEPLDAPSGRAAITKIASSLLPGRHGAGRFNAAIMELGALVCKRRNPACSTCPLRTGCRCIDPATRPIKRSKPARSAFIESRAWIIDHHDRLLLEKSAGPRWKGLWLLPRSIENTNNPALLEMRYAITRYDVSLIVRRETPPKQPGDACQWFALSDTARIPIASPFRRAIEKLRGLA
jgi:A/G-specific adenine glycosylase